MGYKIIYCDQGVCKKYKNVSKKKRIILCCFLLVATIVVVKLLDPSLFDFLIPGDATVTKQAFGQLTENLRNGESVQDAVVAFCQDILDHANLQ